MAKLAQVFVFGAAIVLLTAVPVMAQEEILEEGGAAAVLTSGGGDALISFSGAFGVGLTVIGAAYGIGRLAGAALESMARQPEVAGSIQTAMIIAAALIEGFTFYALFICSTQNPWG